MTKPNKLNESLLSLHALKNALDYDPITGLFKWKMHKQKARLGKIAGHKESRGYLQIYINKKYYMAHRLAWFYVYGTWPANEIDHFDGNRMNNKIENLRQAQDYEQLQNISIRSDNTSGYIGVKKHGRKKNRWQASIQVLGVRHHLGTFATAEEASEAYKIAKLNLHKFNPTLRIGATS